MFLMDPVSLAISLASALVYAVYLNGRRAVRFSLLYMLPMMVVAALVNPAFNHEGATILTYLPSGNPLTLESILYGAAAKGFYWRYYPTARGVPLTPMTVCLQAVYLALCLMPVILNIRADREWGVLRKENEVQPCTKQ